MKKRRRRNRANRINTVTRLLKESAAKDIIPVEINTHEFNLSEVDKITYTKAINNNKIVEVVNVSYEIRINDEWITVRRYDSEHGYLHCHMRISLQNPSEIIVPDQIIKKGTPHDWLTWAINDILKRFPVYRKGFLKRSGLVDNHY